MEDDIVKFLQRQIDDLQEQLDELKEQHEADDNAIENEFGLVWDEVEQLKGVDPEKLGEPIKPRRSIFKRAKDYFAK